MFRRFAESISNAVSNVTNNVSTSEPSSSSSSRSSSSSSDDARVAALSAMGFREAEARHALRVTHGDMQRASEWLLTNGTPVGTNATVTATAPATTRPRPAPSTGANHGHDDEMQRAIQASLDDHSSQKKNAKIGRPPPKSAASTKAGEAASIRHGGAVTKTSRSTTPTNGNQVTFARTTIASHPKVQVPKRLSQHDKEDVILRCAARIAPHPMAVDTLIKSLKTIQAHPNDKRYQTVDTTTAGFQRSLNAPGVLDFFKAMNFYPTPGNGNSSKILQLAHLDPATFYLGISALEQVQQSNEDYAYNKAMLLFDKELEKQLALADTDMEEALKRSEYMRMCPSEPTGLASQITVELGAMCNGSAMTTRKVVSRKFEGDDTLADVVHWLGSNASIIPKKLLLYQRGNVADSDCWYLVDRNHSEAPPYNVPDLMDKTLQYVGCWPSGRLAVVPVLRETTAISAGRTAPSSRGLGAGPAMEH